MHGPILSLCPCTPRCHGRFDSYSSIRSWVVAVYESQLASFDVFRLEYRPRITEKLQTITTGKIRILDQGDWGIHAAPDTPVVPDLTHARRFDRNEHEAPQREHQRGEFCETNRNHRCLDCLAFIRSSTPTIRSGHTTVASLKTSAKRPPSSGETNFPHETPS